MPHTVLTPDEMGRVDLAAIANGPFDGVALMTRAGSAVAKAILERFPSAVRIDVLCGPGNNGGDGYVAAEILRQSGIDVRLWFDGEPRAGSDAAVAAANYHGVRDDLGGYAPLENSVVIDALFGAGLARPVEGTAFSALQKVAASALPVVAVDLPSGVSGATGQVMGIAPRATLTITFVRKKPGHLLYPGRACCGDVVVADIGIRDEFVVTQQSTCVENGPRLWLAHFPHLDDETYKYRRGHVGVFSGGPSSTGAARMSAIAAARIGAGAVTLLSPPSALAVNATHLTSIILRRSDGVDDLHRFMDERVPGALVIGPALGLHDNARDIVKAIGEMPGEEGPAVVFDADALTLIANEAIGHFDWLTANAVLTPHEGEFRRLFPDLVTVESKLERARLAARRVGGIIVYKGPDTVIAAPDGRAAINSNGSPLLATAGSGDVLAGMIGGLAAQAMPVFEAACAGVWLHGEAARLFGPGLIAEDLPAMLPKALAGLFDLRAYSAA